MKAYAEEFFGYGHVNNYSLLYLHSGQAFIGGLCSFWLSRKLNDNPMWVERGCRAKFKMKKWAAACKWNFEAKSLLLEAEEAHSHNEFVTAKDLYEKAIASAKKHR